MFVTHPSLIVEYEHGKIDCIYIALFYLIGQRALQCLPLIHTHTNGG